ncbi:MAG: hypothetical protein OEN21_14210 [Myxococcales bacterium]|nr:hypothetical protein [Myxococcales bacterium]
MRAPGTQRLANTTRAFLDHLKTDVIYDDRNTRELLAGTGISCLDLGSYVDVMVARAQQDSGAISTKPPPAPPLV